MDSVPKVPKAQFDAVLSKLLTGPPLPLSGIRKKRVRKTAQKPRKG